ncbi:MAG: aminodeoxychorismate lyase, partial [Pseudomonas stutzeri]|nr:aminodeoxychorismate lyase [Stutzerimonas stutzeri]
MIRKLLALLLTLFVLAAIALGLFAWKQHAALEQPLAVT